jgi:thiamine-monophosphate kinase
MKLSPTALLLATTDMLIEGVHFDLAYTDYYSLGWKSAAVNLSDIAAMGGLPRYCLTSLGISPSISVEQIADFYRGLNAILSRHQTARRGIITPPEGPLDQRDCARRSQKAQVITRRGETGRPDIRDRRLGIRRRGLNCLSRVRSQEFEPGKDFLEPDSDLRPHKRHLRPCRALVGRVIALSGYAVHDRHQRRPFIGPRSYLSE